jgi:hypothetical protein
MDPSKNLRLYPIKGIAGIQLELIEYQQYWLIKAELCMLSPGLTVNLEGNILRLTSRNKNKPLLDWAKSSTDKVETRSKECEPPKIVKLPAVNKKGITTKMIEGCLNIYIPKIETLIRSSTNQLYIIVD